MRICFFDVIRWIIILLCNEILIFEFIKSMFKDNVDFFFFKNVILCFVFDIYYFF